MPDPARRSPSRRPPFVSSLGREPGLACLAMILYAKFGEHQPLNRQSDSFAREGIDLDVSSLADWVGPCTATGKILAQAFLKCRAGPLASQESACLPRQPSPIIDFH